MEGILPLWKESGMTSHDCVVQLRKILHTKKIGHSGTLDPDVSGVLPICIGKGTKVIEYMMAAGKVYEGEITFGQATTTEDASGDVVEEVTLTTPFSEQQIDQAMAALCGEITQKPPMYSAVKVNGKRLYEYARAGLTVARPERKALIFSFERTSPSVFDTAHHVQRCSFRVACGKGTYIRTLSVDTGRLLGVPAHMSKLVRTASNGIQAAQCLTLAQVKQCVQEQTLAEVILPLETAIQHLPRQTISKTLYEKVRNGALLTLEDLALSEMPTGLLALFYEGQVVSIYQAHPTKTNRLKPDKVLKTESIV